jgi:ribosomal RNA-processing protein 17
MAKPNREILTGGKRYRDAKKLKNRVDEVVFDKDKRKDYLTGFHKRKVERKKKAQEYLEEQAKKDRLEERARIREERKLQVQQKLAEMKEAMELNPFLENYDDEDSEEEDEDYDENSDESDDENLKEGVKFEDELNDEWNGFSDNESETKQLKKSKSSGSTGILKTQLYEIDNENAPVSGTSEVIIESLGNPNKFDLPTVTKKMNVDLSKAEEVLNNSITRAKKYARLMGVNDTTTEKDKIVKPKKKKFRYLSKSERKVKNLKEKSKSLKRRKKD